MLRAAAGHHLPFQAVQPARRRRQHDQRQRGQCRASSFATHGSPLSRTGVRLHETRNRNDAPDLSPRRVSREAPLVHRAGGVVASRSRAERTYPTGADSAACRWRRSGAAGRRSPPPRAAQFCAAASRCPAAYSAAACSSAPGPRRGWSAPRAELSSSCAAANRRWRATTALPRHPGAPVRAGAARGVGACTAIGPASASSAGPRRRCIAVPDAAIPRAAVATSPSRRARRPDGAHRVASAASSSSAAPSSSLPARRHLPCRVLLRAPPSGRPSPRPGGGSPATRGTAARRRHSRPCRRKAEARLFSGCAYTGLSLPNTRASMRRASR